MVANADTKTLDLRWKLKRYYKFLPASCQNCTNILLKYLLLILEVKNARDCKTSFKNIFGTIKLRLQDPAHMNILLYLLLIGDSNVTIYLFTFILHIFLKIYKQTKEYFDQLINYQQQLIDINYQLRICYLFIIIIIGRFMQESQEKRSKFRQQIRRKQINQLFSKVRKMHKQREKNSAFSINDMSQQQKLSIESYVVNFIKQSIINHYNKNYNELMKQITIMKANTIKYRQFISNCINKEIKINGGKYIDINKKDVTRSQLQQLNLDCGNGMEILNYHIQEQFDGRANFQLICSLMQISQLIYYNKFCLESAIIALKFFWNVIQCKVLPQPQTLSNQKKNYSEEEKNYYDASVSILNNLCISLCSLLNNPHHSVIKKHLIQLGFSQKLNEIIECSGRFEKQTHNNIINLVFLYNNMEQYEKTEESLNGIHILSADSNYKQKFVTYSIYLLKRKHKQLYEISLQTLDQLFEQNPYFIDSIKTDYYKQILQMVVDADRKINVAALTLVNTITFYSQSASDELIEQNSILDYIYERLILEKQLPNADAYTKKSIQKCSNILCDLLLTKNNKLKKSMFAHYVWELIFQSMDQNNRLFGTTVVFKYFFFYFGRKQRRQILPSFLEAASRLPLDNDMKQEIKQIKQTLINVFYHSMEHEEQSLHEELLRLYQQNNLLKYIEIDEGIQKI